MQIRNIRILKPSNPIRYSVFCDISGFGVYSLGFIFKRLWQPYMCIGSRWETLSLSSPLFTYLHSITYTYTHNYYFFYTQARAPHSPVVIVGTHEDRLNSKLRRELEQAKNYINKTYGTLDDRKEGFPQVSNH